jgi:hypothetical protein
MTLNLNLAAAKMAVVSSTADRYQGGEPPISGCS